MSAHPWRRQRQIAQILALLLFFTPFVYTTAQRPQCFWAELCIGCGIGEHQCPLGGESAARVYAPTAVGGCPSQNNTLKD